MLFSAQTKNLIKSRTVAAFSLAAISTGMANNIAVAHSTSINPPEQTNSRRVLILHDEGGFVDKYREELDRLRKDNRQTHVKYCRSACTQVIGEPNVCVDKSDRFLFHQPMNFDCATGEEKPTDQATINALMATYPEAVQKALNAKGGLKFKVWTELNGKELHQLGIPYCDAAGDKSAEKRVSLVPWHGTDDSTCQRPAQSSPRSFLGIPF